MIPWISLAIIVGGIYLIATNRALHGFMLIIFVVVIKIIIEFIKHGGINAIKRT